MTEKIKVITMRMDWSKPQHPTTEEFDSFGDMKESLLGDAYMEFVRIARREDKSEIYMLLDEEGLMKGLPVNPWATLTMARLIGPGVQNFSGPVAIFGVRLVDGEAVEGGLREKDLNIIMQLFEPTEPKIEVVSWEEGDFK